MRREREQEYIGNTYQANHVTTCCGLNNNSDTIDIPIGTVYQVAKVIGIGTSQSKLVIEILSIPHGKEIPLKHIHWIIKFRDDFKVLSDYANTITTNSGYIRRERREDAVYHERVPDEDLTGYEWYQRSPG